MIIYLPIHTTTLILKSNEREIILHIIYEKTDIYSLSFFSKYEPLKKETTITNRKITTIDVAQISDSTDPTTCELKQSICLRYIDLYIVFIEIAFCYLK